MSAERRRHDDSLPSDEWTTDPTGWDGRRTTGADEPGDGRPGDSRPDQGWADSYRFDGTRSDEPWRGTGQRGDSSPAAHAWPHGADGIPAGDDWPAGPQLDQTWRYRSLADDQLAAEQPGDDWPGTTAADGWPSTERARGPALPAPDDDWPGTAPAGDRPTGGGRHSGGPRTSDGRDTDSFAADALALSPLAADPFATDLYAPQRHASDDRGEPGRTGPHVVGGRRASDHWLAHPHAIEADDESTRAVAAADRGRLTAGSAAMGGADGGADGGGPGGWDDDRRPGGRRRILVSIMAAVAVALAFGAYGLIRVHDGSTLALQDASSRPCAAHSGRCHSRAPHAPASLSSSGSPVTGSSGLPSASAAPGTGSPTAGARRTSTPTAAPTHPATTAPASMPPPTHVAAPPSRPTPTPSASASAPTGTASSAAAAQVLALINQARSQEGLPALAISSGLNTSSAQHTSLMAGGCGLSHQCSGEASLGARISADGVQWTSAGENIGEGGPVADTTAAITQMAVGLTQSMLNEQPPNDGHRMNILSTSFRFVGITVSIDADGTVWMTQDFSG
jgi:uncharacterized protein YkwD